MRLKMVLIQSNRLSVAHVLRMQLIPRWVNVKTNSLDVNYFINILNLPLPKKLFAKERFPPLTPL